MTVQAGSGRLEPAPGGPRSAAAVCKARARIVPADARGPGPDGAGPSRFREEACGFPAGTRRAVSGNKGSVLMEYVVLCCFTALVIVAAWHLDLYNADEGWTGTMGRALVDSQQRLLEGIAMPVP